MHRIVLRSVMLALVAAVAFSAMAGEGRIPIYTDQNVITAPGKYIVTRNITTTVCGPPLIDIQSSDVDIDINGFVLTGCPIDQVVRVFGPFNNVTVRNGTIALGMDGIAVMTNVDMANYKVVVEDVKIINMDRYGIFLDGVTDFALRRNNVIMARAEGILIDGRVGALPPVQGTIENNQVEQSNGGIMVRNGSSVAILNNRVERITITVPPPVQGGIVYDVSTGGLISNNTVQDVLDGSGIYLGDSSGTKVYNNVVRAAGNNGIYLAGFSDDNLVLNNVVSFSAFEGLRVEGSRNHIDRNLLNTNCTSGVQTCWGLHFVQGPGMDNTFGRNTARGNPGNPQACMTAGPYFATTDFCDEQFGSGSFNDNYMPNFF